MPNISTQSWTELSAPHPGRDDMCGTRDPYTAGSVCRADNTLTRTSCGFASSHAANVMEDAHSLDPSESPPK